LIAMARLVPAIRCGIAAAVGALALAPLLPAQANPIDCSQAFSTVELSVCTRANLERKDAQLKQAMQAVANDAADMPGGTDVTPFIGPGAMRVGGYAAAA
jgi:uncharacterized protein YecT (DUF1311 family)